MARSLTHGVMAVCIALAGAVEPAAYAQPTPQAAANSELRSFQAIRAALQLRDVPLRVHATCKNAAPVMPARSIGDYLAGFLANMDAGRNSVTTTCRPVAPGQRCELWLKHADDEDEWAWGIRFDMDRQGRPRPASVRCLGSG
jgi:hypothetical protein